MKRFLMLTLLALLSFGAIAQITSTAPADRNYSTEIANIDNYIQKVMNDWKIPGMGVVIMKDGKILLEKGYGLKDLLKPDSHVDENTLFQIGSTSKSFTAAVMAQLVDEGLVNWEDTVKNILPDFEMYDPWVTANMQVKDIMTHRSGLAGQIGTYIPNLGYDRDDIYQMFKLIPPAYSFRGDFQYNNITFIIAAKIIEKLTDKSWEENMQERIFDKLGMNESSIGGEAFRNDANAALPYGFSYKDGGISVEPMYGDEQALWWLTVIGPAGGINCTPSDLIKWAEFHRNMGKVGNVQVISEKQMKYLHKGQMITAQNDEKTTLYGQGWYIEQTKKGRLYYHTGTTWGMTTLCLWHPELGLSMTINVNSEASSYPRFSIMRRAIDLFSGLPDYDYSSELYDEWLVESRQDEVKEQEKESLEMASPRIPAPKERMIEGKYSKGPLFGDAWVTKEGGKLYIKIGKQGFQRKLIHKNGNKYNFRCDGNGFDVTFSFDPEQKKAVSFEVDFGEGEDFGPWTRVSK